MPDELKPCPNINCPDQTNLNIGHAGGCWCVSCFCGVRSPAISKEKTVISTREDAIAAWNALPRAPRSLLAAYQLEAGTQALVAEQRGQWLDGYSIGLDDQSQEINRLRAALQKAVDDYGKPGGPWNVPSEPGTWLQMAKEALGGE